jgi:hypothetical protein
MAHSALEPFSNLNPQPAMNRVNHGRVLGITA